jgi:tetratricopeptide (TPR) repeat protein
MAAPEQAYDDAMFVFSTGDFDGAIACLKSVLEREPEHFEAQLALGMAYSRAGDAAAALREGHRAEALRPADPLVHTNLSLFYLKAGDKAAAEHHGLRARIGAWKSDMAAPPAGAAVATAGLAMASPRPAGFKTPPRVPEMPWKKKAGPPVSGGPAPAATDPSP